MTIQENEFPCYYIDSDQASKKAQNTYKGITWAALMLMFLSTILVSISTELTNQIPPLARVSASAKRGGLLVPRWQVASVLINTLKYYMPAYTKAYALPATAHAGQLIALLK